MHVVKIVIVAVAAATLAGCQVTHLAVQSPGHLHAPTPVHGYYKRYPHHHRYDDELGLYIYLESPDTYYYNNYYFRWSVHLNHWERAHEPRATWHRVNEGLVPPKLVKKRAQHNIRHTPAPHAPANGYYSRHPRQHRWDDGLGLFIFLESPDTYYDNHNYFRWSLRHNNWERAVEPRGEWRQVHEREVPAKLLKKRPLSNNRQIEQRDERTKKIIRERVHQKKIEQQRNAAKAESHNEKQQQKLTRPSSDPRRQERSDDCEEVGNGRGHGANRCRD
jgi:hypothetical protein